jgi:hypothetical protein
MNTLKKLLLLSLLFTLFVEASPTQKEISTIINLAGKQRMLTQKMSKEALLIAKGINPKKNQEELKRTITLFDSTLDALLDGDATLKLPKTEDKTIRKRIQVVQKLWREFKPFVSKIAKGNSNRTSLKAIEMGNMPLLSTMDSVVKMYEKKYASALKQDRASTINLAGKERMLSQKMTKELLLIAHNLESNSYMKSLAKGGGFFKDTLFELMQNKKVMSNPHTKREIKEIKKLWDEYQYAIVNTELSKEGLLIFNKKEKEFIQKMTSKLISVATKIDKERYQNDLRASAQEFETVLNGLIKGDKKLGLVKTDDKKIQKELSTVKSYWKEYKEVILNIDVSNNGLKKAMQLNMPILKAMDRAVKLYELNAHQ